MTEEKMEGHGPQGHSYVWDAHMKGKGKAVLLAMYMGVELYTRMGGKEKGNGVLRQIALERNRRNPPRSCKEQTLERMMKMVMQMFFRCFGAHLMGRGWRIEDNERE